MGDDSFATPFTGIYVSKNDCEGTLQWSFVPEFINTVNNIRPSISVNENFVYISFTYYGTMILNNAEFIANNLNLFYAKLDLDGNLVWTRNIECPNNQFPYTSGIVTDSQDNLYFTGRFNGDIYLNSEQLAISSRTTCFVGKFDSDGNIAWFLDEKISGFSRGWSLALDQQENLILSGYFGGDFQLGDFTVTNPNPEGETETNSYVAKINPEGVVQWISVGYCPLFSHPYGITVDSDNNVLAVGGFDQKIQFENNIMESQGRNDGYIVKFSGEDGSYMWANHFGGDQPVGVGGEWMTSVHQKADGNYIAIGNLIYNPELNGVVYDTGETQDIYIVELTNDGEINNAFKFGASSIVEQTYDSYLNENELILASWYNGTNSQIGCNTVNNVDVQDPTTSEVFIWKTNVDEIFEEFDVTLSFSYEVMEDQVSLSNTTIDAADNINWEVDGEVFGSGDDLTLNLPEGEYEVCMVFYACPFTEQTCQMVTVNEVAQQLPVSEFDFEVNGQIVDFADNSSNDPTSWEWTFGDLSTSNDQNPSFEFPDAAIYEVCLTASNDQGTGNTVCENIDLTSELAAPVTDFSFVLDGNTVTLTDNSSNDPNAWQWTFGTLNFSNNPNTVFTFSGSGTYEICLTASNDQGEGNTACQTIEILAEPPVAAFDFAINGLDVNFTDQSNNDPTSWEWTFADLGSSMEQNPSFTFASPGIYEVCLAVSNEQGEGNITCQTIEIAAGPEPPVTAFDFEVNGLSVNFIDQSTNDPNAWEWTFGELGSSMEQNPTFTFPSTDTYEVCLIATNDNGPGQQLCETFDLFSGITDVHFSNNSVYPVPARDFAFIQLGSYFENLKLDFYDLTGKQIAVDYQLTSDGVQVNRTGVSTGLYIYKCSTDGKIIQTGNLIFE